MLLSMGSAAEGGKYDEGKRQAGSRLNNIRAQPETAGFSCKLAVYMCGRVHTLQVGNILHDTPCIAASCTAASSVPAAEEFDHVPGTNCYSATAGRTAAHLSIRLAVPLQLLQ